MENIPVWLHESVHDCRPSHHLSIITFNPQADSRTFPTVVAESEGGGRVGGGGGAVYLIDAASLLLLLFISHR